jgi:hypothetical protein
MTWRCRNGRAALQGRMPLLSPNGDVVSGTAAELYRTATRDGADVAGSKDGCATLRSVTMTTLLLMHPMGQSALPQRYVQLCSPWRKLVLTVLGMEGSITAICPLSPSSHTQAYHGPAERPGFLRPTTFSLVVESRQTTRITVRVNSDCEQQNNSVCIQEVWFHFAIQARTETAPEGYYLFLCPTEDFHCGPGLLRWPDCPKYWVLEDDEAPAPENENSSSSYVIKFPIL